MEKSISCLIDKQIKATSPPKILLRTRRNKNGDRWKCRETQALGKTRVNFSWTGQSLLKKRSRREGLFRRGKTNQPPLVRAHPFSALFPSFVGQRPDRARNIESTRIPLPPLTRQDLELFSDFHISIYLPPPKLWWNTQVVNPRSFVRADLSDWRRKNAVFSRYRAFDA